MNRAEFRQKGIIKLSGKEYLQVAYRVQMFRSDNPGATIITELRALGEDKPDLMYATVILDGNVLATAHKMVVHGARGPAGKFPYETAETGAVGRALALCGYGTLAGDLDEGDQIADAPVVPKEDTGVPVYTVTPDEILTEVLAIQACASLEELEALKEDTVSPKAAELRDAKKTKVRQQLINAYYSKEDELKG